MSHRKPWTSAELDTSREMAAAGHTYAEIARVLGRTPHAVGTYLPLRGIRTGQGRGGARQPCLRCNRDIGIRARGLCWLCWSVPGVKEQYAPKQEPVPPEPTEAELDAMIAEQLQYLPSWWRVEQRKCEEEERRLERLMSECSVVRQRGVGLSQASR